MQPEVRRREDRRSMGGGWVEDNVFVVLGLVRDKSRRSLEEEEGVLQFQPLKSVEGSTWSSAFQVFKVVYKRKPRDVQHVGDLHRRLVGGLQFEPLQRIQCKGGVRLVVHSFRPQRPRSYTSLGARSGVVECEVVAVAQ